MSRRDTFADPLTDDDLLAWLADAQKPMSLREIAASRGLRHAGRRALAKTMSHLKRRGMVEEVSGSRFRLTGTSRAALQPRPPAPAASAQIVPTPRSAARDPRLVVGRLVAHRDGYGFVVPETPRPDLAGDLFIPPDQLGEAMHGDRVMARIEVRDAQRGRRPEGAARAEGRILRVLDRAHPTVVGLFRYGPRGNVVLPYESRILQEIVIPPGEELTAELRASIAASSGEQDATQRRAR